jgi:hypothetical protein
VWVVVDKHERRGAGSNADEREIGTLSKSGPELGIAESNASLAVPRSISPDRRNAGIQLDEKREKQRACRFLDREMVS